MGRIVSFRVKFSIFVAVFITILLALVTVIFTQSNISSAINIFGEAGIPVVQAASKLVDGDKFEHLVNTLNGDDPYYEETRLKLLALKQTSNCRFLYTMAPHSNTTFYYIIDGSCDPSDEENFSALGDTENIASYGSAPLVAMDEKRSTISRLENQEEWGWTVTVYQPIINSSGRAVGFIACDFDARPIVTQIRSNIIKITCVVLVLLIAAIAGITIFMGAFFKRMQQVTEAMNQISQGEGDLTVRLPIGQQDEIGLLAQSSNAVTERLRTIVASLKDSMTTLSNTSKDLNDQTKETVVTIQDASKGIETINTKVQQQSQTMGTVHSSVERVESVLHGLNEKLDTQLSAISSSSSAIEELNSNISSINQSMNLISEEYNTLVHSTTRGRQIQATVNEKIQSIVAESQNLTEANTAINNIAEQTNLLAMNAAIEAAHAGNLGKGFGVVAGEIRHLAETSAQQSSAIKKLIDEIAVSIKEIVTANDRSSQSFADIGNRVDTINSVMQQIKDGMEQQQRGTENILQKISVVNASSSSITDASKSMSTESNLLFSGIETLRQQSSSILTQTADASSSLQHIQYSAEQTGDAAQKNMAVSTEVSELVTRFKT